MTMKPKRTSCQHYSYSGFMDKLSGFRLDSAFKLNVHAYCNVFSRFYTKNATNKKEKQPRTKILRQKQDRLIQNTTKKEILDHLTESL